MIATITNSSSSSLELRVSCCLINVSMIWPGPKNIPPLLRLMSVMWYSNRSTLLIYKNSWIMSNTSSENYMFYPLQSFLWYPHGSLYTPFIQLRVDIQSSIHPVDGYHLLIEKIETNTSSAKNDDQYPNTQTLFDDQHPHYLIVVISPFFDCQYHNFWCRIYRFLMLNIHIFSWLPSGKFRQSWKITILEGNHLQMVHLPL